MQRHLALLKTLFFPPRPKTPRDADAVLDQAKAQLEAMHSRHRAQAVAALEQRYNLQSQVEALEKKVAALQEEAESAIQRGDRARGLRLLEEKQRFDESLASSRETLLQAEETAEQVKVAVHREEEWVRRKVAEALALKAEWKGAAIQEAMEHQLRDAGLWELGQPRAPELDPKTIRELVLALLAVIVVLGIALARH